MHEFKGYLPQPLTQQARPTSSSQARAAGNFCTWAGLPEIRIPGQRWPTCSTSSLCVCGTQQIREDASSTMTGQGAEDGLGKGIGVPLGECEGLICGMPNKKIGPHCFRAWG